MPVAAGADGIWQGPEMIRGFAAGAGHDRHARLIGIISLGFRGRAHLFGLAVELGVMPALLWWLRRIDRLEPKNSS